MDGKDFWELTIDIMKYTIIGIILLGFILAMVTLGCKEEQPDPVQVFDFDAMAEQIDNIEAGQSLDNTTPTGPDGEPVPMSYATTIVDPQSLTELTTISADGSNLGLISRRNNLWRYVKGDTLKSWIESFAGGGGGTDGNGLIDSLPNGSVTIDANRNNLTIDSIGQRYYTYGNSAGSYELMLRNQFSWVLRTGLIEKTVSFDTIGGWKFYGEYYMPEMSFGSDTLLAAWDGAGASDAFTMTLDQVRGTASGSAPLDSIWITVNIEDKSTSLPGTAGDIGEGFWVVPPFLDSAYIKYVSYTVFEAPAGGTYDVQLNKNGATNVFGDTFAAGDYEESQAGSYQIFTADRFKVTTPSTSGATTEPKGMVLNLIIER